MIHSEDMCKSMYIFTAKSAERSTAKKRLTYFDSCALAVAWLAILTPQLFCPACPDCYHNRHR